MAPFFSYDAHTYRHRTNQTRHPDCRPRIPTKIPLISCELSAKNPAETSPAPTNRNSAASTTQPRRRRSPPHTARRTSGPPRPETSPASAPHTTARPQPNSPPVAMFQIIMPPYLAAWDSSIPINWLRAGPCRSENPPTPTATPIAPAISASLPAPRLSSCPYGTSCTDSES